MPCIPSCAHPSLRSFDLTYIRTNTPLTELLNPSAQAQTLFSMTSISNFSLLLTWCSLVTFWFPLVSSPSSVFPLPGASNLSLVRAPFQAAFLLCFTLSYFFLLLHFVLFLDSVVCFISRVLLPPHIIVLLCYFCFSRIPQFPSQQIQLPLPIYFSSTPPIPGVSSIMDLALCSLDSRNLRETSISSSKVPIHLHRLVTLITLSLPYTLPPLPSNLHNSTGRPCPSSFTPPLPYTPLEAITSSPFSSLSGNDCLSSLIRVLGFLL